MSLTRKYIKDAVEILNEFKIPVDGTSLTIVVYLLMAEVTHDLTAKLELLKTLAPEPNPSAKKKLRIK